MSGYFSGRRIVEALRDGIIKIDPFDDASVQPASYDIHLGSNLAIPEPQIKSITPYSSNPNFAQSAFKTRVMSRYRLAPGQFILATVKERIWLSDRVVAELHGKSNGGRWGLQIHCTAGLADPGYEGNLTLELYNAASWGINLWVGMPIGQLTFSLVESDSMGSTPLRYDGHFQGDSTVGLPY